MQAIENNNMATWMESLDMLQHSNMKMNAKELKYMSGTTKHDYWATAKIQYNMFKTAWKKCKW